MIRNGKKDTQFVLFGIMAVVLGAGDSFHLVPRAIALCTTGLENYTVALGIGKFITSITMTIFYVILYYVWRKRYQVSGLKSLTVLVYGLAIIRIILCVFPAYVVNNCIELCFLYTRSAMGRCQSADWNVNDSKNMCVRVDCSYRIYCNEKIKERVISWEFL